MGKQVMLVTALLLLIIFKLMELNLDEVKWESYNGNASHMFNLSKIVFEVRKLKVVVHAGDMMMKSIVFDKKTPNVFYCPLQKPKGFDKLYVHSRPLSKLCEFEGKPPPKDYKPDCYHDVDETEYACKEKHRIMMRLKPPGSLDDQEMQQIEESKRTIKKVIKKKKLQPSE